MQTQGLVVLPGLRDILHCEVVLGTAAKSKTVDDYIVVFSRGISGAAEVTTRSFVVEGRFAVQNVGHHVKGVGEVVIDLSSILLQLRRALIDIGGQVRLIWLTLVPLGVRFFHGGDLFVLIIVTHLRFSIIYNRNLFKQNR